MKRKISVASIILSSISLSMVIFSISCTAYHSKKHLDTMKKDLNAAHEDVDTILGIDEPSPLVEEE
ncbi:MAG: hypothetical protein DWB56_11205 [Candidatus Jettenia sp.]|uniref:Lipoprotein n=1 Tax=Candidatus Jettenia caeni TaxID=247490 RepID=I3IPK4_9BACT|nr:hypothetical protein [Candidatus Jettenia sp. AMX1]MBC6929509.1 hypothetical protein [Candidatus Jettenia sp.]NUN24427.1 hypothetical protein [Candidatus Jettenia caeni]KAA0249404.1 MAG: hypothetical protein EDM77_09025 [Candidatus Jettenia sp. AMX1]MCE7880925.1 hypothetical protein [Candidatus Jettenia sp. AMX1]MCQ3927662.1 hypothetical protein [Candidatus Jettenia sp.]